MIEILRSGVIYRNPTPHVHSVQAYFPSVVMLTNGDLLASLVLAEAFEAPNGHTFLARSTDQGESWHLQGPLYSGTGKRLTSDAARLSVLPDGEVLAFVVRADRSAHPHEGLSNPDTLGFVPTELRLFHSRDYGYNWSPSERIEPSLIGPSFELCCPITPLRDGRWLLPTSTWCDWDGNWPSGKRMVALISRDGGGSWPSHMDVMMDPQQRINYWESKIVECADGRLLAVAWGYDLVDGHDIPNQYVVSRDGETWSAPRSTGLKGQTLTPFILDDGRVLSVYRRIDKPGLWANLSHLDGLKWINEEAAPLWGAGGQGLTRHSRNMSANFNVLRFGAPCITRLPDGTLFIAFWCYEDCVSNIRWFKLRVG